MGGDYTPRGAAADKGRGLLLRLTKPAYSDYSALNDTVPDTIILMFRAATVAQMAAFFAERQGGATNILKLIKLMYLADREFMRRYGSPISFDTMISMPHGPVLSQTLDLINGFIRGAEQEAWDSWISGRDHHAVALRREFTRADLDYLSEAELEVLDFVWAEFGGMDQWKLRQYTHDHCGEWRDLIDSERQSERIDEADVFRALGVKEKEALVLAREIRDARALGWVISAP